MAALVAANLVPLAGVLALGWDVGALMVLFWAENLVIGAYHALRIGLVTRWFALAVVPFFALHYGLFTFVHGVFVWQFFAGGGLAPEDVRAVAFALLALVASHGVSFVQNFVRGGEMARMRDAIASIRFQRTAPGKWEGSVSPEDAADPRKLMGFRDAGDLMVAPYRRIVVLHLTILAGGALILFAGAPLLALVLLVALKTGVDLRAHLRERARLGGGGADAAAVAGLQASSGTR